MQFVLFKTEESLEIEKIKPFLLSHMTYNVLNTH